MKQTLRKCLPALLALCLLIFASATTVFADDEATSTTTTVEMTVTYGQTEAREMLDMINEFRTGDDAWYWNEDDTTKTTCTGLSELTYDYTLEAVAMQRAAEIALSYSHTRPSGNGCETAVYVYYTLGTDLSACGENIAAGYYSYTTAKEAFEAWQETDKKYSGQGHRRNMLSGTFTAVGIAYVTYGDSHFWVQVLGQPKTLNTTKTTALDSEKTVTIEVADSDVTSATLTASTTSYSLSCNSRGETVPTLTAEVAMTNTWPGGTTRDVTIASPAWSSSNTGIVTTDNGRLNVLGNVDVGSTTITASALGSTASVPVTVSHGTTETKNAKDATCAEDGYTGDTVCTVCNKTVADGETIPATGHSYDDGVVTTAATCTEPGEMTYTCANCGATYTEEIAATGHSYEAVVTAPTCTKGGYTTYTCSACGDSYIADETEATGHSYDAVVTAPTCTEKGYTTYTCSVCGDSYTSNETAATGHTAAEVVKENVVAATCTEAGSYDSVVYCSVCGDELSRTTVTDPATGHTAAEAVTENETKATCTEDGSYDSVVYCSVCGEELSRGTITTAATGHTSGDAVTENYVAASHTTDGSYDSVVYCSACGEELSRETVTIAAGGHTSGDPVKENEVDPTCTEPGSYDTVVYCTECGEEMSRETIEIPATGHTADDAVQENNVDATCVTAGSYDSVIYCSVCGAEISRETVIVAATGIHTYVLDEDASTAATCIADGENVYVCSVCGDSYTETVSATGHSYGAPTFTWSDDYSTCTAVFVCENDNDHTDTVDCTVTSATTAATCTVDGKTVYTAAATFNGTEYTNEQTVIISATGHSYKATETVAATYTAQGYTVYTCTVCGDSYKADYTNILVLDETDNSLEIQLKAESLTAVPEGLTALYTSVEALTEDLISRVTVTEGYVEENTSVYDVKLQYRVNDGEWVDATKDNFPSSGITVTLSYPDGTNSSYDFIVMHMFTVTSQRLGTTAGGVEYPAVTKTEDGLKVNLTGLSPVVIAWLDPTTVQSSTDEEETTDSSTEEEETTVPSVETTTAVAVTSADTGDEAHLALWTALLLIACGSLAATVIYSRRKQK